MKLNDQMEWIQEEDSKLEYVETDSRKLFINPGIELKGGNRYIVKVTDNTLTVFEAIAHQEYTGGEPLQ